MLAANVSSTRRYYVSLLPLNTRHMSNSAPIRDILPQLPDFVDASYSNLLAISPGPKRRFFKLY